jgi:hypothetical protein
MNCIASCSCLAVQDILLPKEWTSIFRYFSPYKGKSGIYGQYNQRTSDFLHNNNILDHYQKKYMCTMEIYTHNLSTNNVLLFLYWYAYASPEIKHPSQSPIVILLAIQFLSLSI